MLVAGFAHVNSWDLREDEEDEDEEDEYEETAAEEEEEDDDDENEADCEMRQTKKACMFSCLHKERRFFFY